MHESLPVCHHGEPNAIRNIHTASYSGPKPQRRGKKLHFLGEGGVGSPMPTGTQQKLWNMQLIVQIQRKQSSSVPAQDPQHSFSYRQNSFNYLDNAFQSLRQRGKNCLSPKHIPAGIIHILPFKHAAPLPEIDHATIQINNPM